MGIMRSLTVNNTTNSFQNIYRGPRHKGFVGTVGPKSWVKFKFEDFTGKTYLRAIPIGANGKETTPVVDKIYGNVVDARWTLS